MDGARVGADEQAPVGHGQALGLAGHLARPLLLARRGVDGGHAALAACEQGAARQDQGLGARAGATPLDALGHVGVGLLLFDHHGVRAVLQVGRPLLGSLERRRVGLELLRDLGPLGLESHAVLGGRVALVGERGDLVVDRLERGVVLLDRVPEAPLVSPGDVAGAAKPLPAIDDGAAPEAGLGIGGAIEGHHLLVGDHVRRIGRDDELPAAEPGELGAALLVVGDHLLGAGEHLAVGEQGVGAADVLAEVGLLEQAARLAVERRGRHAGHGCEEGRRRGQQVALGRDAALRRRAAGVVAPQQLAVLGADCVGVDALGGEDARREIGHTAVHQHARAQRPQRDHLAVAKQLLVVRRGPESPHLRPVAGAQAVGEAVVGAEVDLAVGHRRRQPHRAARDEAPPLLARRRVERVDVVVRRRAEGDRPAGHGHLEHVVEVHAPTLQDAFDGHGLRVAPRRLGAVQGLVDPTRDQRRPGLIARHGAAGDVVAIHRPVPSPRHGARERHHKRHHHKSLSSHRRVLLGTACKRNCVSILATDLPNPARCCPGRTRSCRLRCSRSRATRGF